MDNTQYSMESMMECIVFNSIILTMCACIRDKVIADQKMITGIIGHQPTIETMEDFYSMQAEKEAMKKSTQREIDKEKLRRYLMG